MVEWKLGRRPEVSKPSAKTMKLASNLKDHECITITCCDSPCMWMQKVSQKQEDRESGRAVCFYSFLFLVKKLSF